MRTLYHVLKKGARLPPGIKRVETSAPVNDLNPIVICPCCNTERAADMVGRTKDGWECGNGSRHKRRTGRS